MQRYLARWWVLGLAATLACSTEWLRHGSRGWAWSAALLAVATALAARPRVARPVVRGLLLALAIALVVSQRMLDRIDRTWPDEREARVAAAGRRLDGALREAFRETERLAAEGVAAAQLERDAAFRALERAAKNAEGEAGLAILDADGTPWAWAGTFRVAPRAEGDSIASSYTRYALTLESRRHGARGRVVTAQTLLWVHPAVPARERTLGERFRASTGVALTFYPPGAAPDHPDVFDYCQPTTAEPRCFFSAQPQPPDQGEAYSAARTASGRAVLALLVVLLIAGLVTGRNTIERAAMLPLALVLLLRAPSGELLGVPALFSPAAFFLPTLGVFSGSVAALALAGAGLTVLGAWAWGRVPRNSVGIGIAVALLLLVPYLVGFLRRGITPPTNTVTPALWVTWQVMLLLTAAAPIMFAAALRRGRNSQGSGALWVWLGVSIAAVLSAYGLAHWQPRGGWPDWYPFLWVPALLLVTTPAPKRHALVGMAVVAGSLAALVTWGTDVRGRMDAAQREVARLGRVVDPTSVRLLELFGEQVRQAPTPVTATELYALWRASGLAQGGYPTRLAVWSRSSGWVAELPLDSLEVSRTVLEQLARTATQDSVFIIPALPGNNLVLVAPLRPDTVLLAATGPPTQLIGPSRLGRLLEPPERFSAAYLLTLSPPLTEPAGPARLLWRREGWVVAGERLLEGAGAPRLVFAQIDLRGPTPLLIRGAVILAADAVVLALLWLLADLTAGAALPLPRWRNLWRSFRMRLALTLAAFFILPAVAFSIWGFLRLADEARQSSDAVIRHVLSDAVSAGGIPQVRADSAVVPAIDSLATRLDEHLGYYNGGRLTHTSSAVLRDLGVMGEMMDPGGYRALAFGGQIEVVRDGPIPSLAERVGYRLVQPDRPSRLGVLATARKAVDPKAAAQQRDLAFVLALLFLGGVAAAVQGAQEASRALSRPVAQLRKAALALGEGRPAPLASAGVPLEFEPVFRAFERMEADIRAGREALEAARRRTETVLATVATGVVALDESDHVILANRQAAELLEHPLEPGTPFRPLIAACMPDLAALLDDSRNATDGTRGLDVTDVKGRRLSVRAAPLGDVRGGSVLALADVTDLSRAERVLAWGQMARQVAHEIKNPLTPMRLGVQHLQRAWRDKPSEYERVLAETSDRILAEIDRLDAVARAFSRFAAPGTATQSLERVDLTAVAREVAQLYALAGDEARVDVEADGAVWGEARRDELKEVLVNLLENARSADAGQVRIRVRPGMLEVEDDGSGIPSEVLPLVFEPQFSTTTSGSGLGLSIVRRLVESWGGSIALVSELGAGTTVRIEFRGA